MNYDEINSFDHGDRSLIFSENNQFDHGDHGNRSLIFSENNQRPVPVISPVISFRPGLVDTVMAKDDGLFWVMPVEKVAHQIISAIRKKKSKVYVTKRWHFLAIINKNLPFVLYKRI